jgi:hypothetical protein
MLFYIILYAFVDSFELLSLLSAGKWDLVPTVYRSNWIQSRSGCANEGQQRWDL